MNHMIELLVRHGYGLLFAALIARQACLPVPANLLLLAAGALAGFGRLNFLSVIAFSVLGLVLADLAWYEAGRRWGSRTLHFVCGASRNPTSCVDKIDAMFARRGVKALLLSKFVIGLDAVAAPMAGISGTRLSHFLAFDATGAILWSSTYAVLGYLFKDQLERVAAYLSHFGALLIIAAGVAVGVFAALRVIRWHRFVREFLLARITPDELRGELIAGKPLLILDLQGGNANGNHGLMAIPGAVRIDPHQLGRYRREYRHADLATDREVVLYCNCPRESTSARVALTLRGLGFNHVRPLAGGLQAWRNRGFPVSHDAPTLPLPEHSVFILREILRISRAKSAQILKTSTENVDELLERVNRQIRSTEAVRHLLLKTGDCEGLTEQISNLPAGLHSAK